MTHWIALDWGTSQLRAWRMGPDNEILDHRTSDRGMGALTPDAFEPALLELIDDWLPVDTTTPVIACGMVGAKQGWCEAPYTRVPCVPSQGSTIIAPTQDPRLKVTILSGLSQTMPSADVMRGEETQIAGFLAQNPKFDGVICLPGTHTKWAHISAEEVVSFQTFMTGELFSLLSKYSVLRHSIAEQGLEQDAFRTAIDDALSRPATIAARLFELRASDILQGQEPAILRSKLSGYLIGLELSGARPYWLGQDIILIGEPDLCQLYATALKAQGASVAIQDATSMTLAGLTAVYKTCIGHTQ